MMITDNGAERMKSALETVPLVGLVMSVISPDNIPHTHSDGHASWLEDVAMRDAARTNSDTK